MDFSQRKLSRSEWDSVEKPITQDEQCILQMIIDGYTNPNIRINTNTSFVGHFKVGITSGSNGDKQTVMDQYIYNEYFKELVDELITTYGPTADIKIETKATAQLNSSNKIRFSKINKTKIITDHRIYEFLLLSQAAKLCGACHGSYIIDTAYYYYSLYHLIQNNIDTLNPYVAQFIREVLQRYKSHVKIDFILQNASHIIEQNECLLKYADQSLYSHQKQIFGVFRNNKAMTPKLVLYMAPTGTGKTMTPIALAQEHRIIFMCAARHIGLALARAAISMGRKIAFAFGCDTAGDIRLHYSAAAVYTTNTRTGGIKNVDNSVGNKVEIMICDVKSYIPAMNYMLAHNPAYKIITYWDEPTILLDIPEHDMHTIIQHNWSKNKIPNMVLSSATLPSIVELRTTIDDFIYKHSGTQVETIHSYDCKKSIPLFDSNGFVVAPHYLAADAAQLAQMCHHCETNPTLLRYLDLQSVSNFITYVNGHPELVADTDLLLVNTDWFSDFDMLTMNNIKMYYLKLCQFINAAAFQTHRPVFLANREHLQPQQQPQQRITRTQSVVGTAETATAPSTGVYITTKDAHTLTDGPTIFITNDIKKIVQFCIQQANIPEAVMTALTETITKNNVILEQIAELQKTIDGTKDATTAATTGTAAKANARKHNRTFTLEEEDAAKNNTAKTQLTATINDLRTRIKTVQLNNVLIPNKCEHIQRWASASAVGTTPTTTAFTSNIDEDIVTKILNIDGLENYWKILLLMGIGVFMHMDGTAYNSAYMEIMKELAADQKLYLIIASSDYIYGTNYQFCHGYLSKDLTDTMTQEKIIQALGRIGRSNIQQHYSARFRDNGLFIRLFTPDHNKPEVANMRRLFSTSAEDLSL